LALTADVLDPDLTMLGRRKHERYLLSEPVDASLRLREEVAIERWGDGEVIVLSPEPLKPEERLALEIPGGTRSRLNVKVSESRAAVSDDGAIRYRLVLSIEAPGPGIAHSGGPES
jgi:hypothetical protein